MKNLFHSGVAALIAAVSMNVSTAFASGAQPETPLVIMSESDGQAQLGVKNTEVFPLLMNTTIEELSEAESPVSVLVWPPVSRLEAGQRQVVRFVLDKSAEPLKVQMLKRVSIEGLTPRMSDSTEKNTVRVNIRTTLPLIISPKGLEQIDNPWTKLEFTRIGSRITVTNSSPFVVRLQQGVDLLPSAINLPLFPRTYVLPGDSFSMTLPNNILASTVTGMRIYPASPWGFAVDPYEVKIPVLPSAS